MPAKKPAPKRAPKHDDPDQSERFIATGKALGADKDPRALDKALKKVSTKAART
jgi:hypothetical protein